MRYEKPEFVEIKMDAEIGSYQNDFDDVPVAEPNDDSRGSRWGRERPQTPAR
jgi:hypothetical protein